MRAGDDFQPGARFGEYEILAVVGVGGMGMVYRALDRHARPVALKVLPSDVGADSEYRARFQRECQIVAQLTEPHIIPIHGYGEIDGLLYLDMRLVDAVDLRQRLRRDGPIPAATAVAIVAQIAEALDAAHAAGVVHRDVKPANVLLVERTGELVRAEPFAYLIDFGIARSGGMDAEATNGSGMGTLDYMAPERFDGVAWTPGADVYALGGLLHEMLTAAKPFPGRDAAALMRAHFHGSRPVPSQINPDVPVALDAVVATAMAVEAEQRYSSAGDLAAAARSALDGSLRPENDTTTIRLPAPGGASGQSDESADRPSEGPAEPPANQLSDRNATSRRRPRTAVLAIAACVIAALVAGGIYLAVRDPAATTTVTVKRGATTSASASAATKSTTAVLTANEQAASAAVGGSAICTTVPVTIAPSPQNESLDAAVRCSPVQGPFADVYAFHVHANAVSGLDATLATYAASGSLTALDPSKSTVRLAGHWGITNESGPVLLVLWPDRGVVVAARPLNAGLADRAFAAMAKAVSWQYGRFGQAPDYGTQAVVKSLTKSVCTQQRLEDQVGVEFSRIKGWVTCAVPAGVTSATAVQLDHFDGSGSVVKEFAGLQALGYTHFSSLSNGAGVTAGECVAIQSTPAAVEIACRYPPIKPIGSVTPVTHVVGYLTLSGTLAAARTFFATHSILPATLFQTV